MNLPNNAHMTRTKHEKASKAVRAQEQKELATSTDAVKGTVPGANPGAAPNADLGTAPETSQGVAASAISSAASSANQGTAQGVEQETAKPRSACETVKLTRLTSKGG